MISANELMIGDWIEFTSKYGYGTGQIAAIEPREGSVEPTTFSVIKYKKDGTIFYVGVSKTCVRPIPLTPEILEKNGFKIVHGFGYSESYPTYGWGYHKGLRDYAFVDVTFYDEPIGGVSKLVKMETASKKDDGINSIHSCVIEFVHQLQHALRLVGIEKEIKL